MTPDEPCPGCGAPKWQHTRDELAACNPPAAVAIACMRGGRAVRVEISREELGGP